MAQFLTYVYLFYIFISLYFLFLYLLIYIPNRKEFFRYPKPNRQYSLDMIMPCYNEGASIEKSINALLDSDYPGLKKIIVVDDCSTDDSFEIIKKIAAKNSRVMALKTPKNAGRASGPKNYGAKFADSELIGFTDADSYPEKTAIRKMVGFFNEEKVGAVTSAVLVEGNKGLLQRLQSVEYRIIVFTRRLFGFVDAIYVTPGPLAIYRKSAFDDIGRFDEKNMTEDIEIAWHFIAAGYKIRMSSLSRVYTEVPTTPKVWFKQRLRWNLGGVQTIQKYRKAFMERGILGSFILPFFMMSWVIGISGLVIMFYRLARLLIVRFLSATYSVQAQTALLSLQDINLVPSVLFFFGVIIILFGMVFTLIALKYTQSKEAEFKKVGPLSILGYSFLYLLTYPVVLIISLYTIIFKRKHSW